METVTFAASHRTFLEPVENEPDVPVTMPTYDEYRKRETVSYAVSSSINFDSVENEPGVSVTMPTDDVYSILETVTSPKLNIFDAVENEPSDPVTMPTEVVITTFPPNDVAVNKEPTSREAVDDLITSK